jgi:hypothetical protein
MGPLARADHLDTFSGTKIFAAFENPKILHKAAGLK